MITTQEERWAGPFGDAYTARNRGRVDANKALFSRIMASIQEVKRVIEFGAGAGENLTALRHIMPFLHLVGVEINEQAVELLGKSGADLVVHAAIAEACFVGEFDLAFTKGLLIHIAPQDLPIAFDRLYAASRRYVLLCEYHSPRFEALDYRGEHGLLWKGPYAEMMLEHYSDLKVRDYGFAWSRDPIAPQDDLFWALMEKKQ